MAQRPQRIPLTFGSCNGAKTDNQERLQSLPGVAPQSVSVPAAQAIAGQTMFEKIYLLAAIEPGLEAFETYPTATRRS